MSVSTKEIRQARAYLYSRGLNSNDIPPKLFALTAKKLDKTFRELLTFLALVKAQGQGAGPSPIGKEFTQGRF